MQLYELLYIIKQDFSDDQAITIAKEVTDLLTKNATDLQIKNQDLLGRKKFAYPIEHLAHGFYVLVDFTTATKDIAQLKRLLELDDKILRYLIIKKEVKSENQIAREKALLTKIQNEPHLKSADQSRLKKTAKMVQQPKDLPQKDALDNKSQTGEELNNKLDEILKRDIV